VKQITDIFLNFSNFLIGFTELQYSCTHKSTHKNEGGNNRLYSKNEKKINKYCLFLAHRAVI